jgi:enoyl-CoA hydratase/carnithine racemase
MVLLGDPIAPERALQIGLVSQVVTGKRLAGEGDALVKRILDLDPEATRRCKGFFQTAQQNSFDQNCRLAVEALTVGSLTALARKK